MTSSALALPGLAGSARADAPRDQFSADYSFSLYREDDIPVENVAPGSQRERFEVQSHQIRIVKPWSDRIDLDLNVLHETMSGASPLFVTPGPGGRPVQVMSGATIEEARTDVLPRANYYMENGRASVGVGASVENDYLAINVGVDGERHFNDRNTTLSTGVGASFDTIEPTDSELYPLRPKEEKKTSYSVFTGLSQVTSRNSAVQATLNYTNAQGFLSDPYKEVFVGGNRLADTRPDERNQLALLTRYRHHVPLLNGTGHANYRYYLDDWDIQSHTIELAWYQSVFDLFQLAPSFRYYSQSQAEFYAPFFDQARNDGLHTSDYRLSPYGAISYGLKAEARFPTGSVDWFARLSYERYESRADWALGSVGVANPGLVSFHLFSFNLRAAF